MADTVTWSLLRELANFRAEKGCATSLYLNLDPSEVPTAGDAQTRMNALLNAAEKTDRKDLTHEQRSGLKNDFERIARWFDDDFDRDGAQGLAVFAAGLGARGARRLGTGEVACESGGAAPGGDAGPERGAGERRGGSARAVA